MTEDIQSAAASASEPALALRAKPQERLDASRFDQAQVIRSHVRDFRWRANQCRTNLDAFDSNAAAIWDWAADALEGK